MAARGYCTSGDVAAYLGRALDSAQTPRAAALVAIAETYIDRVTRRGWLLPPIVGERHEVLAAEIYLLRAPVASVQAVRLRSRRVGDVATTLVAGSDYELLDADQGLLQLAGGFAADYEGAGLPAWTSVGPRSGIPSTYVAVDYTPDLPVPGDIALAAAQLVAHWLDLQLDPSRFGVAAVQFGAEVRITYDKAHVDRVVPQEIADTLLGYREVII